MAKESSVSTLDDIFRDDDKEIFPGQTQKSRKTQSPGTTPWVQKKSLLLHKGEEEEFHKEKNLLKEDTADDESTGYVPPPSRLDRTKENIVNDEPTKSQLLAKVFRPFSTVLACAGFFPYYIVEDEDAYFQVLYKKKSVRHILFNVAFFLYVVVYLMTFVGFIFLYNDWPTMTGGSNYIINATDAFQQIQEGRWELIMISNYWVMLIVVWCWMTMGVFGTFHTWHYAEDYGHFHSYWHKTITMLDVDPTDYVKSFLIKESIMFGVMTFFLLLMFLIAASFRICCALIGCAFLGVFANDLPQRASFPLVQFVGFIIVFYGYSGTRACLVQFVFYCRLVTNTAKIWNYRFESVLVGALFHDFLTPKMFAQYRIILKDHFLVVQLYKLTEGCFGGILQFYYLLQTTCLVLMTLYLYFNLAARRITIYTYKNYSYEKFDYYIPTHIVTVTEQKDDTELGVQAIQRALHTIFYVFLFFQGMFMCFHVTSWAQIALDEGMDGFNVLRKHGLVMCTNRSERNLIHSLTISFARNNPLAITADGYFTVDKQLFLGIIAIVVNYVTMLIQFNFDEYLVSSVDFRMEWGVPSANKTLLKSLPE